MWSWIKSLIFKEIVYGVIDSTKQKKNWLGFTLFLIENDNSGITFRLNKNVLSIGFGDTIRSWYTPKYLYSSKDRTFSIDIFGTGYIYYSVDNDIPFMVICFWKYLYKDKEFMVNDKGIKYDVSIIDPKNRMFILPGEICLDDHEGKRLITASYRITIWRKGNNFLTRFIMDLFGGKEVVCVLKIEGIGQDSIIIGVNTHKEKNIIDMCEFVVETSDFNIKELSLDHICIIAKNKNTTTTTY